MSSDQSEWVKPFTLKHVKPGEFKPFPASDLIEDTKAVDWFMTQARDGIIMLQNNDHRFLYMEPTGYITKGGAITWRYYDQKHTKEPGGPLSHSQAVRKFRAALNPSYKIYTGRPAKEKLSWFKKHPGDGFTTSAWEFRDGKAVLVPLKRTSKTTTARVNGTAKKKQAASKPTGKYRMKVTTNGRKFMVLL